jgi:hydrogenase-4 component E
VNTELLNVHALEILSMIMVITSVAVVEVRALRVAAGAYAIQALLMVALLAGYARGNHALYWWAGTAFITKAILTPWFLFRYIGKGEDRELKPLIGFAPSVGIASLLMVAFFRLTHSQFSVLAPMEVARAEVFRTNLAVASTVFALGIYAVLTRRDALKTVMGLCLLENGVHLSLVSLAPELPETALFGVATEVVVTVFLLLYVIAGVRAEFGTTDTLQLKELQR